MCTKYQGKINAQFINSQIGFIVGTSETGRGFISKTTNGGINWVYINSGIENWNCRCISFINLNTGWIGSHLGVTGRLLKTTNSGINWSYQDFPGSFNINSVKFFDSNNGLIITEDSSIYKTTNDGLNWQKKLINNIQPANNGIFYRYLCPINNNEMWALVVRNNYGYIFSDIYKTTNGGDNWILNYAYSDSLQTNSNKFFKLNFINSSTGFAGGGYSFLVRTTNGGVSWDKVNLKILDLLFISSNELFASADYGYNSIYKSTNLGMNWTLISHNWPFKFIKTKFLDINTGYIIADTGRIYKTSNNGDNWNLIYYNTNYFFQDISFANSSTGCIISYSNPDFFQKILRTTNNGNNWHEIFSSQYRREKHRLIFLDQLNGFAGADSSRLLKTTNSGLNWNLISLSNLVFCDFLDFSFINSSTGWVSGYKATGFPFNYNRNIIWKTTNAGNNWNIIYDSTASYGLYVTSIYFTDNNFGYRFLTNLHGNVQITTNSGTNWINYSFPHMYSPICIKLINNNTGWVVGDGGGFSKVIKTTNGGINWFLQFQGYSATYLDAYDENHAWFCGYYSDLYKTTNGGGFIGIKNINTNIPKHFYLYQNYPNPFNPNTTISYKVKSYKVIKLVVYDILGKEVAVLVNEKLQPGTYETQFPINSITSNQLPSGVYFYSLFEDGERVDTKKMVLLK